MFQYSYNTKIGEIFIAEGNGQITNISFKKLDYPIKKSPLIEKTFIEIDEYLKGKRKTFDIPLALNGSPFQIKVWQELKKIPYGQTRTYKDIAKAAGNEKACRAVGMANNKNPIAIIIPCHRVLGQNGDLTGYAGGLDIKRKLLNIEHTTE